MISKRLDTLRVLTAWLEGIGPSSGDQAFDLQGMVFRGRRIFGDDMAPPYLSVLESPKTDDPNDTAYAGDNKAIRTEYWYLNIQGFAPDDDPENPTDPAYQLMASVEFRLSRLIAKDKQGMPVDPDNFLLGKFSNGKPRAVELKIGPGLVLPPTDPVSKRWAFFFLPLTIERVYDPADPFELTP